MITELNFIVAYDISKDRTRNKISKILEGYGDRVQNSVFELPELSERSWEKCLRKLKNISAVLFEEGDSIRIYKVPNQHLPKTIVLGNCGQKPFNVPKKYVF